MIALIERLQKNTFLDKMQSKANKMYEKSWQPKLQSDAYMQGVKDTLKEIKK